MEQVLNWLNDTKYPAVRYYAMHNLGIGSPEDIELAKNEVMNDSIIQTILQHQNMDGSWGEFDRFYLDKYHGTVWQLLILAQIGADGNHMQIKKGCKFLLDHVQDKKTFGFSLEMSKTTQSGLPGKVIPCLTGNMVYTLIQFGYLEDERVQKAIEWILNYQRTDDGENDIKLEIYDHHKACFGNHSCFMGVVKNLKALSMIPKERRSDAIEKKIRELAEFMLKHNLYKKSHDLSVVAKDGWTRFGFPLMYQTDLLEILDILNSLNICDERMDEGLKIIKKKQLPDGRWLMQNTFNGKMYVDIEKKNQPSRWITAKALKIFKYNNASVKLPPHVHLSEI